jgi:hypothetical protein
MSTFELLSFVARSMGTVPTGAPSDNDPNFVPDITNIDANSLNPLHIKAWRKMCTLDLPCNLSWATMHYLPNFAGNAVYLGCFAILLIGQLWFGFRHKTWKYMVCVCLGIIGEMVGYFGRLMYNKNPYPLKNFLM